MGGDELQELAALVPPRVTVTVGGESLEIGPVTIGQLPAFMRAVQPVMPAILAQYEIDIVELLAQHGERLIEAAAVGCGRPAEWVGALDPVAFVELAGAVIEVNLDFFGQRLMPAVLRLTDQIASAGAISSSSSSSTDTPPL